MISVRKMIRRINLFIFYRVLRANDTPHRLALGLAISIFVAWTPTMGLQMLIALALALLLRANARVTIPIVWISNPLTMLVIYMPNYWLGRAILNLFTHRPKVDYEKLAEFMRYLYNPFRIISQINDREFWTELGQFLLSVSLELWIGSIIIGLFLSIVTYVASYKTIVWYRTNHPSARRWVARLLKIRRQKL